MTEVTRIACPGCRVSLQFKPEALDFPATCAACDCRFSVGIYVRLSCPRCHQGSKIRESYRGRRVRCIRCQHDFLSDDGIPAGDGGRVLVARMLDTDALVPPETVQPFVGSDQTGTEPPPIHEDVARGLNVGPATISGSGLWNISQSVELERLRAEVAELRARQGFEVASARKAAQKADDRWSSAEGKLVETLLELEESQRRTARVLAEREAALDAANLERSTLLSKVDRLNAALRSAAAGESNAQRLAEEALRKFDAALEDLRAEQRRRLEVNRVMEEREAEVAKATGRSDQLARENERLAELVERLLGENQAIGEEAERLRGEIQRLTDGLDQAVRSTRLVEENRRLTAAIEQAHREAESLQTKLARELERAAGASGPLPEDRENRDLEIEPDHPDDLRTPGEAESPSGEFERFARGPRDAMETSRPSCPEAGGNDSFETSTSR